MRAPCLASASLPSRYSAAFTYLSSDELLSGGHVDRRQAYAKRLHRAFSPRHVVGPHVLVRAQLDAVLAVELVVLRAARAEELRRLGIEVVHRLLHALPSFVGLHQVDAEIEAELGVEFLLGH